MLRAIVEEAAALLSIAAFVITILIWANYFSFG